MSRRPIMKSATELVVIIIGVLIALFAENRWQQYQDRVEGHEYILRLAAELETNQASLDGDTQWATQSCASAEAMLQHLRQPRGESDAASILQYAVSAAMHVSPRYQRITYDDLVATGRLSLIEDSGVREQLVSAYSTLESEQVWRPSVEDRFRWDVLRSLPLEYVERVLDDCVRKEGEMEMNQALRPCTVVPADGTPEEWLSRLSRVPDIEGDLSERVYGICRLDNQLAVVRTSLDSLASLLEPVIR